MKFRFDIELKEGFNPTMQIEKENEVQIIVEAKNMVTANRMMKSVLLGCDNIVSYSVICID